MTHSSKTLSPRTGGRFITIEGTEGVGKSTNIALVREIVARYGHEVLMTREPGGTGTGERVREILLDKDEQQMTAMTELLLMFAARAQHVEEVIRPAVENGIWVISDRFTDSSYAYQGGGRELGSRPVELLESLVLGDFRSMLKQDLRGRHLKRKPIGSNPSTGRFSKESEQLLSKGRPSPDAISSMRVSR